MSVRRTSFALALLLASTACKRERPAGEGDRGADAAGEAAPAPKPKLTYINDDAEEEAAAIAAARVSDDPVAYAFATVGRLQNREATIPPQCYTKTEGRHNPCWTCHTPSRFPNAMDDWELQGSYDFSDEAKTNHWTNLFEDRRAAVAAISDADIRAWIAEDNYPALRAALADKSKGEYPGYRPDLDFAAGFDEEGFAKDQSGWRAFRYKPFPGAFWPTNGSADDVMIRLPARYRQDDEGQPSRAVYKANLAILEASLAGDPLVADSELRWPIEAIDERAAGIDLDGDGSLEAEVRELVGLPTHYAGGGEGHSVRRGIYPEGTEFLHSVRYLDPEGGPAPRMKELRYSRKFRELPDHRMLGAYAREAEEKAEGGLPLFGGNPLAGMRNNFGWLLQGFIENPGGELRVQTEEEHYTCMGCHSNLGVTADQSFAFPRKLPGAAGWAYQDLAGIPDVPQLRHEQGELRTYLERAGAADEFRANTEMKARYFNEQGELDEAALAKLEQADLAELLTPSPARALELNKAYLVIVREQSFDRGRDPVVESLAPTVHAHVDEPSTGLSEAKRIYTDGTLRLDWSKAGPRGDNREP